MLLLFVLLLRSTCADLDGVVVLDGGSGKFSPTCVARSAVQLGGTSIAAQCCDRDTGDCRRHIVGANDDSGCMVGYSRKDRRIRQTTFEEAEALCASKQLTLCADKNCSSRGCGYNKHPVWTSQLCELEGSKNPTGNDQGGILVLDGGSGTFVPTCVARNVVELNGASIAAQCCHPVTKACRRHELGANNDEGCMVGFSRNGNIQQTTYVEAAALCASKQLTLCSNKNCENRGCNYNNHPVWTSQTCDLKD